MKFPKFLTAAFVLALFVGLPILSACNDGTADAGSGVSQAEFDQLKQQVADLEKKVDATRALIGDHVTAPGSASGKTVIAKSAASGTTSLGTYLATLPGKVLDMVASDGTKYRISNARTASDYGIVQPAPKMYFEQANCQGTPWINFNDDGVPADVGPSQYAFRNTNDQSTADDSSTYWMIAAGTTATQVNVVSELDNGQLCSGYTATTIMLQAVPDTSVVPKAPVQGPFNVGQ